MNIILDDIIYWLQKNGGASRYWYEISSRLNNTSNFIFNFRRTELTENPWAINNYLSKFLIKNFFYLSLDRYLDVSIPKEIYSLNRGFIFHSSHYRVSRNKFVANVVTVHDFTYEMFKSGLARYIHVWQKKRAIKNAEVVICISEYTKSQLLKFYPEFEYKQIAVIHHGVGSEFKCNKSHDTNPTNELVFLGTRDSYKRFDLMIEATKHLSEMILTIVGPDITPVERYNLERLIPGRWQYLGRLSDGDLCSLYNRAFCFVFPSDSEGFGLPLLEAMSAGCPVVCASSSVFPEVAGNAALFAFEQTGEAYARQIDRLKDPVLRQKMILLGFKRINLFTWQNCFEKTLGVYQIAHQILLQRGLQ